MISSSKCLSLGFWGVLSLARLSSWLLLLLGSFIPHFYLGASTDLAPMLSGDYTFLHHFKYQLNADGAHISAPIFCLEESPSKSTCLTPSGRPTWITLCTCLCNSHPSLVPASQGYICLDFCSCPQFTPSDSLYICLATPRCLSSPLWRLGRLHCLFRNVSVTEQ